MKKVKEYSNNLGNDMTDRLDKAGANIAPKIDP